jgi:hypothetical protein
MKLKGHLALALLLTLSTIISLTGCGSSSGSSSSDVSLRITSPAQDSIYSAGSMINFELETINFKLNAPHDHNNGHHHSLITRHDHPVKEDPHHHHSEKNPDAREGHYHVYLNDASGKDPHLTAWSNTAGYQLPANIQKGTHSLRFELRDNDHIPVGVEAILFFSVEK